MTLTITGVASYTLSLPPSVRLTATATTGAPNPVVDGALITLVRIHADGSRHNVLTGANPRFSGGGWSGLDCHCPFNQFVTYEITAGAGAASVGISITSTDTWLVHASLPALSVKVDAVASISDRTRASMSTRFQPVESPAVFLTDGLRKGVAGSIDVRLIDPYPIDTLLDDDSVILINTPGTTGYDLTWLWVQPKDVQYVNPAGGWVKYPFRHAVIPFEEAAAPVTESAALTCLVASGYAATCTAYAALYTTCTQASLDVR